MKAIIKYLDNNIAIDNDTITCIEIENKNYFYRIVSSLNKISNGCIADDIIFYDNNNELNMENKLIMIFDYFNIDLENKKIMNSLYSIISKSIKEEDKIKIDRLYRNISKIIQSSSMNINLPILFETECNITNVIKSLSLSIKTEDDILSNLLILIDEMNTINDNRLIVLINIKQYLTNSELIELYKYSIYNNVKILLIDSQSYGVKLEYEKKLIIDNDLEEYML